MNHELKYPREYSDEIRKFEVTDRGHADIFNAPVNDLINNDAYMKDHMDVVENTLAGHTDNGDIHVTAAQKSAWTNKAEKTVATTASAGLMGAADKSKLDGIKAGAEVNQNAISTLVAGSTNVTANSKTAAVTLTAGNNITITGDNATKKVTISAPTAIKNPQPIAIQLNGTTAASYDGSAAKTVNITPAGIGAPGTATFKALEDKVTQLNSDLINKIYPVGSIYMSVNSVSPSSFIGGTWVQIKDTFLLSAGSTYAAGSSGGAASVALTAAQMPAHNHNFTGTAAAHSHTFTGTAVVSGGNSASHTHSVTAKGSVASTFSGSAVNTNEKGNHTHSLKCAQLALDPTNNHGITYLLSSASANYNAMASAGAHTHSVTAKGSVASTFSGTAVNTGGNSVSHTHSVTAKGTNSNASIVPSGTIGSTGSGAAHSNMPPYLTVYMWKRTA